MNDYPYQSVPCVTEPRSGSGGLPGFRSITMAGFCLSAMLALAACGGEDNGLDDGDDNGNGAIDPGGDTSGYSGLLSWRFGDDGEGSGIRLWQLQDSDFKITVDEAEQGGAHKAPLVTPDERMLVYTVDPVVFSDGEWSQVQWLDMEAGELRSLPREISNQSVRASFGSDVGQFGSVISFAEKVYESSQSDVSRYGAGVWIVNNEQAETLVQSDEPIYCTRMDPNASIMIFDQPDGFYQVNTGGGTPQAISINHPSLGEIDRSPKATGHCPYELANNGNRLAFTGTLDAADEEADESRAAFFTDLNSGQTTRLASSVELPLLDWQMAANGDSAVLLFRDDDNDDGVNYVLKAVNLTNPGASTEIDRFTLANDASLSLEVAISGNGQVVARSGYDEDGIHIKVMTASGTDHRRIQGDAATMGDGVLGLRL